MNDCIQAWPIEVNGDDQYYGSILPWVTSAISEMDEDVRIVVFGLMIRAAQESLREN